MNNMNISSKNSVSKTTERGQKSEITSNRKECTSCAQNIVDSKNDISNAKRPPTKPKPQAFPDIFPILDFEDKSFK